MLLKSKGIQANSFSNRKVGFTGRLPIGIGVAFFYSILWAQVQELEVQGMVCSFCAQGIEKKLKSLPAVEHVQVRLGEKKVTVQLKQGQAPLSEKTYRDALQDAGYDLKSVTNVKSGVSE